MYEHWDSSRCRKRTLELLEEQLFVDLYDTLKAITTEYGEPSPAELWDEASRQWKQLLTSKHPQMAVKLLKDELTDIYGERSAFLVLMILMYMLVAMFRPQKNSPYHEYCVALAEVTQGHPLLKRLWEGVRQKEDEEERAGRKIDIVKSLLSETTASADAIDFDTLEHCVLRFPTIEMQLQALDEFDKLLRGTAWSKRSADVEAKIYTRHKEQQNRLEQQKDKMIDSVEKAAAKPTTQIYNTLEVINKKETNIDNNYGPNIDNHDGGVLGLSDMNN